MLFELILVSLGGDQTAGRAFDRTAGRATACGVCQQNQGVRVDLGPGETTVQTSADGVPPPSMVCRPHAVCRQQPDQRPI